METTPSLPLEPLPASPEDWFLQFFVKMVNGSSTEIPVTLLIGGAILSGSLVSGHRYFDEIGAGFVEALTDKVPTDAIETFDGFMKKNSEVYTTEEGRETAGEPTFIHLREARYFHQSGAPIPSNQGIWWRGRISEIDGWSFGGLIGPKG